MIVVLNPNVKTNGTTRLRNVYRITRRDDDNPFLKLSHHSDPFEANPDPRSVVLTDGVPYPGFRHNPNYIEARRVFCEGRLISYQSVNPPFHQSVNPSIHQF